MMGFSHVSLAPPAEAPCRRVPDRVSVSRIAYFKRKFVEDDDEPRFSFRTYCQTVSVDAPVPRVSDSKSAHDNVRLYYLHQL